MIPKHRSLPLKTRRHLQPVYSKAFFHARALVPSRSAISCLALRSPRNCSQLIQPQLQSKAFNLHPSKSFRFTKSQIHFGHPKNSLHHKEIWQKHAINHHHHHHHRSMNPSLQRASSRFCTLVDENCESDSPTHQTTHKNIFKYRTESTSRLWEKRLQLEGKYSNNFTAKSPEFLDLKPPGYSTPKNPRQSIEELILPFSQDGILRDEYLSPFGHLRVGKLLEDLDAMAGNVAYHHSSDQDPSTRSPSIVTACVDKILIKEKLRTGVDVRLHGMITHVGKSSIEIKLTASGKVGPDPENPWKVWMESYFVMVARDLNKAWPVNPLVLETEEDKQAFQQGEENKRLRLEKKKASLKHTNPTLEEYKLLHSLFLTSLNQKNQEDSGALRPSSANRSSVLMSKTHRETLILCQPSEKNIHGKIFGGYLMRKSFELGFSTAFLFARVQPFFLALDDVVFLKPVEIGSILDLKSKVICTKQVTNSQTVAGYIQVEVLACVLDPLGVKPPELTNTFLFTFMIRKGDNQTALNEVIPETYEEGMSYIEGKRILDSRIECEYSDW